MSSPEPVLIDQQDSRSTCSRPCPACYPCSATGERLLKLKPSLSEGIACIGENNW
jgi:hypothetical protein